MTWLQVVWFLLIGVLLTGFAVLDGFDLGAGFWHLFAKGDKQRRTILNAVGPTWDGNEVWLLTGGGAIFAAFPPVYASVFSGFYLAMMLVVLCLIARAVSMEFRSKEESPRWRATWDAVFGVSSSVAALLFGVALGNVLRGIPLDEAGDYTGGFFDLLNPYALLIGLTGLAMLLTHGANFIALKAGGELHEKARGWGFKAGVAYLALYVIAAGVTVATQPHLTENHAAMPVLWAVPVLGLVFVVGTLRHNRRGQPGRAFIASSLSIAAMMGNVGAGLFPRLVPALNDPALSLTAANSSSSEKTLMVMFILALVGMPLVLGYTIWVYKMFAGKVDVDNPSNHY
ncbi:MAG: cytochrome d ubiquinol oxidase subunit II [Deltaproteobacteria bacterium]|jgi:cytochrome d ubiquinol oxidase subunit II|nr:cytochrome d ubiquinol oxidase subunit II [Deltaproteobacteria bacterium]